MVTRAVEILCPVLHSGGFRIFPAVTGFSEQGLGGGKLPEDGKPNQFTTNDIEAPTHQ